MRKATEFERGLDGVLLQYEVAQVDLSHEAGQIRVELVLEGDLEPMELVALEAYLGNRGGNKLGRLLDVLQLDFEPISNAQSLDLIAFAVQRAEDVFGERGLTTFDDGGWAVEEARVLFGYLFAAAGLCTRETTAQTKLFQSLYPEDDIVSKAYRYGRRLTREEFNSNVVVLKSGVEEGEEEGFVVHEGWLNFDTPDGIDAMRTLLSGFAGEEGKKGGGEEAYRRWYRIEFGNAAKEGGVVKYLFACDLVRMVAGGKEERERRENAMINDEIAELRSSLGGDSGDSVALKRAIALHGLIDTVGHRGPDGEYYERLVVIKECGRRTTDALNGRAKHSNDVFQDLWSLSTDKSGFTRLGGMVVKGENGVRVPFTTFIERLVLWFGELEGRWLQFEGWLSVGGHTILVGLDKDGVAGKGDGTGGSSRWRRKQELERRLRADVSMYQPWWGGQDNSSFNLEAIFNVCVEGNVDGDIEER